MSDEKALRRLVRAILQEVVVLSPQEQQVKAQISKLSPGMGGKAGVLFSRMKSRRIEPDEAEQMADEVRSTIAAAGGAGAKGLQQAFDQAYSDLEDGLGASSGISNMISQTLASPPEGVKHRSVNASAGGAPQSITMRSMLRAD